MRRAFSFAIVALAAAATACGGGKGAVESAAMRNDVDSMSYVLGMNIAYNLMEIDSTINVDLSLIHI